MLSPRCRRLESVGHRVISGGLVAIALLLLPLELQAQQPTQSAQFPSPSLTPENSDGSVYRDLLTRYCIGCHNERLETAGLSLESVDPADVSNSLEVWEKVVRKLRTGTMPPSNRPQPPEEDRESLLSWLETSLDSVATSNPRAGRTETLRRLNRTEYQNSIRDLLAVDIDSTSLLPSDESGHGFDNVNVSDLTPALLDRYISAAQRVSRLAIGTTHASVQSEVVRVPADVTQEDHVPGLPLGTRGGISVPFTFVQDGEYDIQIRLARNRGGFVGGLRQPEPHALELLLDRERVTTFTIEKPPEGDDHSEVDSHLEIRTTVSAGPHDIGVTFFKRASSLIETERQPLQSHFNETRHPRQTPAVYEISITGPYNATGVRDTPSRRKLFVCRPEATQVSEERCARDILASLMRRAYRRPVVDDDFERPMTFYRQGRVGGDFDAGIGSALNAVLMSPKFLFRVEVDPTDVAPGTVYDVTDLELASRLSFFLWSSIPDDELLDAAIRGALSRPEELLRQTRRMLLDSRSFNLASNFAGQWLRLRNLEAVSPNVRLYPDFDDNLRQAFRQETELFFDSVIREDRSIVELLKSDYTFLNERLAKHYGIPNIYGSRFRRVALDAGSKRGGLLRHGSILSVTSYATRTSPVIRGVWVLDNIFGAPPPPPLPNVPSLDENAVAANLPMRERLAAHRSNVVCANCHRTIDPVGFALENFDAIGRWRDHEGDNGRMDASGGLPGIGDFVGVAGLEEGLVSSPALFAGTLAEKLLTFALGRGVDYYDAPAIRKIVREAESHDFRFSSLIVSIVKSVPFQMRNST